MITLAFTACLMATPAPCVEIERRMPDSMPVAVCERQAVTAARQWLVSRGNGYFVRWVGCREDHSA